MSSATQCDVETPKAALTVLEGDLGVLVAAATATEPTVGLGAGPSTPFIASARGDSRAKPTDGGLARNTEYTFLRNVSPTIHGGALPLVSNWKNAPRQRSLDGDTRPRRKSAGEIGHDRPPKAMLTSTAVEQG
jgi:hypothetical protein